MTPNRKRWWHHCWSPLHSGILAPSIMRAQSLGIPSVLDGCCGPEFVWLRVMLPGAKGSKDDVIMWWNRIDIVPNVSKCPVPASMWCPCRCMPVPVLVHKRAYRYRRYRYWFRTGHTEMIGTGIGVPNLQTFPAPVLMSYRTYRSLWYRF